jgi:quinol monooxygenase YgiN
LSITRISEFQSKEGTTQGLREFLMSIMPIIKSSKGSRSVQLYQRQDEPSKFMMIEEWDDMESHQASVKNIPPAKLAEVRPLLSLGPSGAYYGLIDHSA